MRMEIEVKARVSDMAAVEARLSALGIRLSEPLVQDDTVFTNYDGSFDQWPANASFLRIRKSNGRIEFNIKQSPSGQELVSREHEVEINNAEEMEEILALLGFKPSVRVHKTRRKGQYGDYEICLDEVEGLGSFIEVEKITDSADHETVLKELADFLESIGVDPSERVMQGYDTLLYQRAKEKS